jgi:sulfur-carrier protein
MSATTTVSVKIPTPLRNLTQGRDLVPASGATVREVIDDVEKSCPGLRERVCEADGRIRAYVRVFVNDEDIRFLKAGDTAVKSGDVVTILPAIAGGLQESDFQYGASVARARRATSRTAALGSPAGGSGARVPVITSSPARTPATTPAGS